MEPIQLLEPESCGILRWSYKGIAEDQSLLLLETVRDALTPSLSELLGEVDQVRALRTTLLERRNTAHGIGIHLCAVERHMDRQLVQHPRLRCGSLRYCILGG